MKIMVRLTLALLLALSTVAVHAQFPSTGRIIRVVQFNFQRANLFTPQGKQEGRSVEDAILVLKHLNPDLMNLNEIERAQAKQIAEALDMNYVFGPIRHGNGDYGACLFSRTPVLSHDEHFGEGKSEDAFRCIELSTEIDGRTLHFFGTHPRFNDKPIKEVQMLDLMGIIGSTSGTKILAGDFNDMDTRPNWYSHRGYINLITGGSHGSYLDSAPKMYDFQRKCGIAEQTKFNPPYFSLKTDWDGPDNTGNSISQWQPRVRIDHIFVSPDFYLDDPRNRCETVDTQPLLAQLDPDGPARIVGDHRIIVADMLLPKPVKQLIVYPDMQPLALPAGGTYTLHVGGLDADGNGVALYATDAARPADDPSQCGRMTSIVNWQSEGDAIALEPIDFPADYDPYLKFNRPSAACAVIQAQAPGKARIDIAAGEAKASLEVVVVPAGTLYETEEDVVRKNQ